MLPTEYYQPTGSNWLLYQLCTTTVEQDVVWVTSGRSVAEALERSRGAPSAAALAAGAVHEGRPTPAVVRPMDGRWL